MSTGSVTNLVQFRADLLKYAEIAEVGHFDDRLVARVVDTYAEQFATGTITVRTTTHDVTDRNVNFRYMTPDMPHNPVEIARSSGLLPRGADEVHSLLDEVTEKIPVWWGLDASVGRGVEKVWAFLEEPASFDDIAALRNLPRSVRAHRERFGKAGLDQFLIMAFDFRNNTMNLYSEMLAPARFSRDEVSEMVRDMNSPLPDDEQLQRDTEAFNVYYTFDWQAPTARRLCFAIPAAEGTFPTHWHPLAARFAAEAPFQAPLRGLLFNPTYGPTGGHLKLEADYTGDAATRVFGYWSK
ncbi:aromatic prenyltransferase [Streptomyces sp. NPDC060030]|uniref:aromatic prenyltransferase n=1 Tax=Streptomyces sp. NPDC060030 TaxID=3347042 RepID=UPI0036A7A74E